MDASRSKEGRMTTKELQAKLRTAIANYMFSEGCDCCQGDDHKGHKAVIAGLLGVPMYSDGSGHDFTAFRTQSISE